MHWSVKICFVKQVSLLGWFFSLKNLKCDSNQFVLILVVNTWLLFYLYSSLRSEVKVHITFLKMKKKTTAKLLVKFLQCVVCVSEKLLNFNNNLVKLCSSINNPFKVFT